MLLWLHFCWKSGQDANGFSGGSAAYAFPEHDYGRCKWYATPLEWWHLPTGARIDFHDSISSTQFSYLRRADSILDNSAIRLKRADSIPDYSATWGVHVMKRWHQELRLGMLATSLRLLEFVIEYWKCLSEAPQNKFSFKRWNFWGGCAFPAVAGGRQHFGAMLAPLGFLRDWKRERRWVNTFREIRGLLFLFPACCHLDIYCALAPRIYDLLRGDSGERLPDNLWGISVWARLE